MSCRKQEGCEPAPGCSRFLHIPTRVRFFSFFHVASDMVAGLGSPAGAGTMRTTNKVPTQPGCRDPAFPASSCPVHGAPSPALDSICLFPPEGTELGTSLRQERTIATEGGAQPSCLFSPNQTPWPQCFFGHLLEKPPPDCLQGAPEAQACMMGASGQSWEAASSQLKPGSEGPH